MNKSLLIQTLIESGVVPSRSIVGLYPQVLSTLNTQIKQSISDDSSTNGQVSENTSKINTINAKVNTLTTDLAATSVQVESNTDAITANTDSIVENRTAIQQANTNIYQNATDIKALQTKVNNLTDDVSTYATKTEIQAVQSNIDTNTTAIDTLNTDLTSYKNTVNTALTTHTTNITELQAAVESLEELKADVEKVNENAQKINEHAAQYETLVSTVEGIRSIKADVDLVQAAKADIQTNLNNITANTNAIAALTTRATTTETNITSIQSNIESLNSNLTNINDQITSDKLNIDNAINSLEDKDEELTTSLTSVTSTITEQSATLDTHGTDILQLKQDVIAARNIADSNKTALNTKANIADVNAVSVVAEAAQTQASTNQINIANNTAVIGVLQESITTKLSTDTFNNEITNYAKKSELPDLTHYVQTSKLSGLVAVDGTNVTKAEHNIVTKKNNKNITAKLWNETSGGGVQMKNENAGKISFVGVNNGDGDNEIWVQQYAKIISTNIGARTTLSTDGFFYTKNQNNGSYTANDEVVTKKDLVSYATNSDITTAIANIEIPSIAGLATVEYVNNVVAAIEHPTVDLTPYVQTTKLNGLVSVDGVNVTKSEHNIVTKKNNKNITAKIWNETSGGGAQMKNEDAGKVSFIGVNNGDGDNEIWVQGYAKNISNNTGTRMTLSTTGMYYTKNQANGSYTADDEIVTKKDLTALLTTIQEQANEITALKEALVSAGIINMS